MAKNTMQSAWDYKRKEEERLQKAKLKKQHTTDAQPVKAEEQPAEENQAKS